MADEPGLNTGHRFVHRRLLAMVEVTPAADRVVIEDALAGGSPQVFTLCVNDAGQTVVVFGEGSTGTRLPTGVDAIAATYRYGIGRDGNVGDDPALAYLDIWDTSTAEDVTMWHVVATPADERDIT
jgi:hypothetical protein